MSTNIILLGAPGAGKGTQAKHIVREFGVPQISMGDILREKKNEVSPLGDQIQEIMASGALVPDEVVIEIIRERLQDEDCANGFILDGFPRTVGQADALDQLLEEIDRPLAAVIYLDVPLEALLDRLTGRRICSGCKHEYHVQFNPPEQEGICDQCGGTLEQRADDREDTIRKRLDVFTEQTAPLCDYYERKGKLVRVDGLRDMDAVYVSIQEILQQA